MASKQMADLVDELTEGKPALTVLCQPSHPVNRDPATLLHGSGEVSLAEADDGGLDGEELTEEQKRQGLKAVEIAEENHSVHLSEATRRRIRATLAEGLTLQEREEMRQQQFDAILAEVN